MITDLTAFLNARIDEDEVKAKAAQPGPWTLEEWTGGFGRQASVMAPMPQHPGATTGLTQLARVPSMDAETATHIARHDPARVLREVAAKRAIVTRYAAVLQSFYDPGNGLWPDVSRREKSHAYAALCDLAAIWVDHPDYQDGWAS